MNINYKKIFILLSVFLVLSFMAVYKFLLPQFIDENNIKNMISNSVNQGYTVDLEGLSTSLTWDLAFEAKLNKFVLLENKEKIIEARGASLKIPLVFLALKQLNHANVSVIDLDGKIIRDNKGTLNLQKVFKSLGKSKSGAKFYAKKYNILFKDNIQPKVVLRGNNLAFENRKNLALALVGDFIWDDGFKSNLNLKFISNKRLKKPRIRINSYFKNLNLEKFSFYLKNLCPDLTSVSGDLDGSLNFDNYSPKIISDNFKLDIKAKDFSLATKKHDNFMVLPQISEITSKGKYFRDKLYIDSFNLKSLNCNLELAGKISYLYKKNKKLDIQTKVTNSRLSKLALIVPKNIKIKNDALNKGLKYKLDSFVDVDLSIKGSSKLPEYYGKIIAKNFVINEDIHKSKSKMNLTFKKREVKIKSEMIDSKGSILSLNGVSQIIIDKHIDYDINFVDFDLNNINSKLSPLSNILNFKIGPLSQMKMSGDTSGSLHILGATRNADITGDVKLVNSEISHAGFSDKVFVKNSALRFNGREIIFNDFNSYFHEAKTTLNGKTSIDDDIDLKLYIADVDLTSGLSFLRKSSMLKKASDKLKFIENISGQGSLLINFNGTKDNLLTSGHVKLNNAKAYFKDYSSPANHMVGKVNFNDKDCIIDKLGFYIAKSPLSIKGKVENEIADIKLYSASLDLASGLSVIKNSKALKNIAKKLSDIYSADGKIIVDIKLDGNVFSDDIFNNLDAKILSGSIKHRHFITPIYLEKGVIKANKDTLFMENLILNTIGAKGKLDGKIETVNDKTKYDLVAKFDNLNQDTIAAIKKLDLPVDIKNNINNFTNFSGSASANLRFNDYLSGNVKFNNLKSIYTPLKIPCILESGDIIIEKNKFKFNNIGLGLGSSEFNLSGDISSDNSFSSLFMDGTILVSDVDNYLNKIVPSPINLKKSVPLKIEFKHKSNGENDINLGVVLSKGNNLSYRGASVGNNSGVTFIGGNISGNSSKISIQNLGIHQFSTPVSASNAFKYANAKKNLMGISGYLNKGFDAGKLQVYLNEYFDVNLLNSLLSRNQNKLFEGGSVKGNLSIEGDLNKPKIIGALDLKGANIPYLKMKIMDAKFLLDDENIFLKDGSFKIADSDIYVDAIIKNVLSKPFMVKELSIKSPSINVDEIVKVFEKEKAQQKGNLPILVVENGSLLANNLILNNLLTKNARIKFVFTPDWIMNLKQLNLDTAGGNVIGDCKIDFTTKGVATNLKFKNIKANAVATTLLQLPNEIYGILNGEAQFTTKGASSKEFIQNANGNANFNISSGRLVRLGSVEYLLMASEVVKSGVTGLSINNVLTLIHPKRTGAFDSIEANLKIKNGVVFSDNLVSQSKNLGMFMAGSFDMTSDYSDIIILGRISKSVTGFFGPVGNFSINKIVHSIPGVKNPSANVKNIFPRLSKIPGIDFHDDSYRRFIVNIEGNLYDSKSVKKFKWID